jgi:hypothetical protein
LSQALLASEVALRSAAAGALFVAAAGALGFAAAVAGALFVAAAVTLECAAAAAGALFITAAVALGLAAALSLVTPWGAAGEQEKVASKFLRSAVHASIMPAVAVP